MKGTVYLIFFTIVAVVSFEYYRGNNSKNNFVPSILSEKTADKEADTASSEIISKYLSAAVSQRMGDYDAAIKHYENSLAETPQNTDIPKRLYGLYLYEGRYDEALSLSKRNIEINEANKISPEELNPNPYLLVALDELKKGNYKEVIRILKPLTDPSIQDKSHIDGVVIPLVISWAYVIGQQYEEAFNVIDNITTDFMLSVFSYNRSVINDIANGKPLLIDGKEQPIEEKTIKLTADLFNEIGQYSMQNFNLEESIIYFRLARFLDPDLYKFKKILAIAFEAKGEFENAIKVYNEVSPESEYYKTTQLSIALSKHSLGQDEEAITILEKLKEDEKLGYSSMVAIGSILMSQNKHEESIKYFSKAEKAIKEISKDNWAVFFNLGVANDRIENWEEAEVNLKKSIQLFPENPESLNYLAYSWIVRNKNIKQARAMLESAVIRSGGAPHILDSYGWALYKLGFYKEALPFLEQAALSLPYNAIINDHLGDVYWALGRHREARFQWSRAVYYYDEKTDSSQEITLETIQNKIDKGLNL